MISLEAGHLTPTAIISCQKTQIYRTKLEECVCVISSNSRAESLGIITMVFMVRYWFFDVLKSMLLMRRFLCVAELDLLNISHAIFSGILQFTICCMVEFISNDSAITISLIQLHNWAFWKKHRSHSLKLYDWMTLSRRMNRQ